MNQVLVFINPASRQGAQGIEEAVNWLNTNGFEILNPGFASDQSQTNQQDMFETITRFKDRSPIVIVGGGDGSVNHALPSLMRYELPLLLIPLGTANNLARTLLIPTSVSDALSLLKTGRVQKVDVGIVRPLNSNWTQIGNQAPAEEVTEIPFMNVVGLGMSARVNRFVPSEQKRWLGVFAFAITALRVAARMNPFKVTIECDGRKHRGRSWQVTVCNGRNYGNGLTIDSKASLQDQTLHGISTEIGKWWHGFGLIPALRSGKFTTRPEITTFSGHVVQVTTKRSKHVDIDGDIKARTPIEISVRPSALRIYVPTPTSEQALNV